MANERKIPLLAQLIDTLYAIPQEPDMPDWQLETLLPTSHDLAKSVGCDSDTIKKLLKTLIQWELVHPLGFNPKRYRFDHWRYASIDDVSVDDLLPEVLDYRREHMS